MRVRTESRGDSADGTFNAAAGAVLELAPNDSALFSGTYTGSGLGKVQLTGTLRTSGAGATFDFPDGLFDWVSGSIVGAGVGLINDGTIGVTSANDKILFGVLVNNNTIRHRGTGRVLLNTSSVLDVPAGGVYDFEGDGGIGQSSIGGGGTPAIELRGTLRKSGGAGTSLLDGATPNPFTFVGQTGVMDDSSGLYFMRNRIYDPAVGRFTQRDPIGFSGSDANTYRYVQNNPLGFIDPLGLEQVQQAITITSNNPPPNPYAGNYEQISGELNDILG